MLISKGYLVLNVLLLVHVKSASAENIRRNRKLGVKSLTRMTTRAKAVPADGEDEWAQVQQIEMSMPTTAPPSEAPVPTAITATPTATPTATVTMLPALVVGAITDDFAEFSMQECHGDCDSDTDCAFGLICYQRSLGDKSVPGCSGDADLVGDGFDDFCIQPVATNTLVIVGDEGFPLDVFPLGECKGDCDEDAECAEGLVCLERDASEIVPGCDGTGGFGWDYCYDPANVNQDPPLQFLGDPADCWDFYELSECQGDCDYDAECGLGLICFQRNSGPDVPGCTGNAEEINDGLDDFCAKPQTADRVVIMGDDSAVGFLVYPLGNCQGECDEDADCAGDLKCFLRDGLEQIPGCIGEGEEGFDYCASF